MYIVFKHASVCVFKLIIVPISVQRNACAWVDVFGSSSMYTTVCLHVCNCKFCACIKMCSCLCVHMQRVYLYGVHVCVRTHTYPCNIVCTVGVSYPGEWGGSGKTRCVCACR